MAPGVKDEPSVKAPKSPALPPSPGQPQPAHGQQGQARGLGDEDQLGVLKACPLVHVFHEQHQALISEVAVDLRESQGGQTTRPIGPAR